MCNNTLGIDDTLLSEIKPFLNGMDMCCLYTLASYIKTGSFERYKEKISNCRNTKIKTFYDMTASIVEEHMNKCSS